MRISILASGSHGNACYVEGSGSKILVDAGLSGRELLRRLHFIGVKPETIDAMIITHEHVDHIRGAGILARRLGIPVHTNVPTLRKGSRILGNLPKPIPFHTGQTITIGDLYLETFTKCHDAADPMGLVITSDGIRLGMVTDLGRSTHLVEERLRGCQALIIEFNHDIGMLENGPYPLEVKQRIRGSDGHLSNLQAGELLRTLAHKDLHLVVLAHISKVNNCPKRAAVTAREVLSDCALHRTGIFVSGPEEPGPLLEL
jgi:phosphoribosyl 1,2-cyclic phosphodiesterase